MLYTGKLLGHIRITTNDTTTISENTDDTAVLPVGDSFLVRKLKLAKNVPALRLGLQPAA